MVSAKQINKPQELNSNLLFFSTINLLLFLNVFLVFRFKHLNANKTKFHISNETAASTLSNQYSSIIIPQNYRTKTPLSYLSIQH